MLKQLILTNWAQHRNLTVDFTEGLNAIRGPNESGKTKLFYAVQYAFWGSRAMPDTLDEVVSAGFPVGSAKVELTFDHTGSEYQIVRSKSGARLTGPGVSVEGQAEVSSYVNKLFKATHQIAQQTLVIGQKSLTDTLSNSSTLVESLAETALIEKLVTAVQTHSSSGNTKFIEQQLASIGEVPNDPPPVTYTADFVTAEFVEENSKLAGQKYQEALTQEGIHQGVIDLARQNKLIYQKEQSAKQSVQTSLLAVEEALADIKIPAPVDISELEALRDAENLQRLKNNAIAQYASMPAIEGETYDSFETYNKKANEVGAWLDAAMASKQSLTTQIAVQRALLISDKVCGLCQKDLTEVPEVIARNAATSTKIDELQAEADRADVSRLGLSASMDVLRHTALVAAKRDALAKSIPAEYLQAGTGYPKSYSLVNCEFAEVVPVDREYQIKLCRQANASNAQAHARIASLKMRRADLEREQAALVETLTAEDLEASAKLAAAATKALADLGQLRQSAQQAYAMAVQSRALAEAAKSQHDHAVKVWEKAKDERAKLLAEAAEMAANNIIIKKLRDARPVVVKELWNTVLHVVTDYFSQVRGRASAVTRDDDGFLVDGMKAKLLSGSTQDALGLANRLALQKVFLGGIDFMMVDEGAAAMDADREAQMIAALSNAGLRQVIMISHSPAVESYASNLIELQAASAVNLES